ncbi:hypothetical protein [Streptomyces sp. NPDC023838]
MTRTLRRGAEPAWHKQVVAASLTQEHVNERPGEPADPYNCAGFR